MRQEEEDRAAAYVAEQGRLWAHRLAQAQMLVGDPAAVQANYAAWSPLIDYLRERQFINNIGGEHAPNGIAGRATPDNRVPRNVDYRTRPFT